ncbi:MarR family transcriptional regulator [Hoyosella rhizosphaerae]|uniref:HTH marR-type domain-containing protein n=1 Tax=Hoyosella rhizosphaerae TaxID=1755582 RepID=A0A916XCP7_9ACTN|nr:MarR family transcriptional regulator [Hoyosella rhizosphaerae]MBN4927713.1 MarR family transcriptional regulator [Hoyosella rhizosphaerae]GGC62191.1 hypothetical protein GCM10011410_13290 [Hoyosella rhizosphaerae]
MSTQSSASNADALDLVIALHRLVRSIRRSSTTRGLTPTQLVILAYLKDNGAARIGELATYVPCSQPTATTVVNSLQDANLVERIQDEDDRRAILVTLTKLGRAALRSVAESQATQLSQRIAMLDDDVRTQLADAIPILTALAESAVTETD